MSRKREPMRKIKEVLRLAHVAQLSERDIAHAANMKKTTVRDYLQRVRNSGLTWKEAESLDDETIDQKLFPPSSAIPESRAIPDWGVVHRELRRKGVTLQLLWEEYREEHPAGYGYSRFCELYQKAEPTFDLSMRQVHRAGEKLFVDYSGKTIDIIDQKTGECRTAEIFVAVMGASNYTFAEATWSQQLPDWIGSHVRAFRFYGGVPTLVIPDNLKSGVKKACFYDPEINPTYQRLACHYGVAILPTRAVHPKDKSKVENAVQVVQRWILARLRNRRFFSLPEANEAISELLEKLNDRPFRKIPDSRRSIFEQLDRPALRALPNESYEYEQWKKATVNIDYHVELEGHRYSVPYQLVREEVQIRFTATIVEIFHKGKRKAAHARSGLKGGYTTLSEHMPSTHRFFAEWTPQRMIKWAGEAGPSVGSLVEQLLGTKIHPEQGFRSALGIIRLGKKLGNARLKAACRRALAIGGCSYRCVVQILDRGQDRLPLPEPVHNPEIRHENIRGATYYKQPEGDDEDAESTHH